MPKFKQSPICTEQGCTGWMEEKDGWMKCRSCGYMKKVTKPVVTPLPKL